MTVAWQKIEPYFAYSFGINGRVERQEAIDEAFAANESDDVIDTIDAIGSRIFASVADTRAFLEAQGLVSG